MTGNRRILVTGGAGFIGHHFVHHVLENNPDWDVTVVDALTYSGSESLLPSNIEFVRGDILNEELMDHLVSRCDTIIHFAAETHIPRSIQKSAPFFLTNVMGTQILADLALRYRKTLDRLIYVSTSEVYGTAQEKKMSESHPLDSHSPYAASKAGADRLIYSYWKTHHLPFVIVRPFNNYGPGQHVEKAIPRFITHCMMGEAIQLHGDGSAERDWVYVRDHCEALLGLLEVPIELIQGEVFNIGSGSSVSIRHIAELICEILHSSVSIDCVCDRLGAVPRLTADFSKLHRLTGWTPQTSLGEGLKQTILWFQEHSSFWRSQLEQRHVLVPVGEDKHEWH